MILASIPKMTDKSALSLSGVYSGLKTSLKKESYRTLMPLCPVQKSRNSSLALGFQELLTSRSKCNSNKITQ